MTNDYILKCILNLVVTSQNYVFSYLLSNNRCSVTNPCILIYHIASQSVHHTLSKYLRFTFKIRD